MTHAPTPAPAPPAERAGEMSHREVLEALSGLLLAMFVAMLSSTVVSNALPRIVTDLEGSQTGYTWVVVATMLAMTATTPIWGKFADLFDKKLLVQTALIIFSIGSLIAGFAPSMEVLIGARVVQGLGVGGLTALVQVVIATMVSPRERGRYSGYIGAVFALATVSGPLVGGVLVDTVGWRWCFFAGLPVAALAFVVLQKTLRLPVVKRDDVSIDYLGAFLLVGGVSILLVWVSLGGINFDWISWTSGLLVAGSVAIIAAAVHVEANVAKDPVIPLRLFKDRTLSLATVASVLIGVAMFGSTVYLSLYFQRAKDMSPTEAGLMSICMVGGLLVSSILSGRIISATGVWKRWLVGGMVAVIAGIALLSTIDAGTPLW
ncbi:MAG: MFS transporter, partial [Rhodococcus sp. (in: high G+C Gram-positive bacteria)]